MKKRCISPCLLLFILFFFGCSGGPAGDGPPIPDYQAAEIRKAESGRSHLALLGLYAVSIDVPAGAIEAVPRRDAQDVLNVLGFLEPPPMTNLAIDFGSLEVDPAAGYVGVDVILTHPLGSNYFCGFEVRGVVFGADVTNADGSTRWLNPREFSDLPWGYKDGLLGAPDSYAHYDELYNDYKLFTDSYPNPIRLADQKGEVWGGGDIDPYDTSFQAGESKTAHYDIDFGDDPADFLIFNYAIIANYAFPGGPAPWAPEDFPLEAHCPEPFLIDMEVYDNQAFYEDPPYGAGGTISMGVRVHDWSNPGGLDVRVSVPGLGIPEALPSDSHPGGDDISWLYYFELIVTEGNGEGYYPMTVAVTDPVTYGEAYFLDSMPAAHLLHDEPISVTLETEVYLHGVDIFIDPYQVGYLLYDAASGETSGRAVYDFRVEWPGIGIDSVELDASPLGLGVMYAYEPKGESGYIFCLNNSAGLIPGDYQMNYAVHFANAWNEVGYIPLDILDKDAMPPPIESTAVVYGGFGTIGFINLITFETATCGINVCKKFESNGVATDCLEYRWIQVISTDDPYNEDAPNSYVDPWLNDGVPKIDSPFYWGEQQATDLNEPDPFGKRNPWFMDETRRSANDIPPNPDPTWWHGELILVCVRLGQPDVLMESEHFYYFKHSDGSVDGGHYGGEDGGSAHARDVLGRDFPGYDFQ